MRALLKYLIVAVLWSSSLLFGNNFRGLPYFIKIKSIDFLESEPQDPSNPVEVCYQFSTTVPTFDYVNSVSQMQKEVKLTPRRTNSRPLGGDPQSHDIEFKYIFSQLNLYAYLNSKPDAFSLSNLLYFNSAIRSYAGVRKPLKLTSFVTSFRPLIELQYEWITTCEVIPFGKAFSKRYIQNLFSGPGPIGYLKGHGNFSFTIVTQTLISPTPVKLSFNSSSYRTPVFGTKELTKSDFRMIAFSHSINSLNIIKENNNENIINEFLNNNSEIVRIFQEKYHIKVELPMSVENLVSIIQKVSVMENHSVDSSRS